MSNRIVNAVNALTAPETIDIMVKGTTTDGMNFEGAASYTGKNEIELVEACAADVHEKTGKILKTVTITKCSNPNIILTDGIELDNLGKLKEIA
jgi:hypothetical protein